MARCVNIRTAPLQWAGVPNILTKQYFLMVGVDRQPAVWFAV